MSLKSDYTAAIADLKKVGVFVEGKLLTILQKAEVDAPMIESITALVSPQIAALETTGAAVLNAVINAIEDAGEAAAAGGLNVSLDAVTVAAVKAIIPAIKAKAAPAAGAD